VDGLNDRADKTDERLKKQKEFFSGPGLVGIIGLRSRGSREIESFVSP